MPETFPKISIVTPSMNQARFLEKTICSILDQNYPNLEYVIIDGGSTDESIDIIKKYAGRLHYWVSEKDGGQYDALNKGFSHTTGDIMAYLNSDDMYLPWALKVIGELFHEFPSIEWLSTTNPMAIDKDDRAARVNHMYGFTRSGFFAGENLLFDGCAGGDIIQQESTFWRRSLWNRAGARFNDSIYYAGDFDLWVRFFQQASLVGLDMPLACFRYHDAQKTADDGVQKYLKEAREIYFRAGGKMPIHFLRQLRIFAHLFLPRISGIFSQLGLLEQAEIIYRNIKSGKWVRELR